MTDRTFPAPRSEADERRRELERLGPAREPPRRAAAPHQALPAGGPRALYADLDSLGGFFALAAPPPPGSDAVPWAEVLSPAALTARFAAVRTAAATATALGLSERKVQPVVLIEQDPGLQRVLVNDGTLAASVIMTGSRQVEEVTRLAPRRHRQHRRVVLTAALLPVPAAEAATR